MGRHIIVMKLICSFGHCECNGHTVHMRSQRHLTADWLAPRDSDCSRMHSKVSSDWLPCYIKATRPVLEIFKWAGYFPDSPRTWMCLRKVATSLQVGNVKSLQSTYTLTPNWTTIFTSRQHSAFVHPLIEYKVSVPLLVVSLVT